MSAFSKLTARACGVAEGEPVAGIDFAERLDALAAGHPDSPDWRRSIVDLLRILDLDASYGARKRLALELGYGEETLLVRGSAEMNLWLRDEVSRRLGEAVAGVAAKPKR